MRITRFEDIEAWKEARKLTQMVYQLTGDPIFGKDFGLASQMQRAAVSTMGNIAEGFESASRLEFLRFLSYTRRSTAEVQCHLYAALDQRYIDEQQFGRVYRQAETVRKLVAAFVRYLRGIAASSGSSVRNRQTGKLANRQTEGVA